jgi:hypothetical protein
VTLNTLQADVNQNEADADAAIAALQTDVDGNESDADNAIAALQSDVDGNEADADNAIAALQSDVDGNEADADNAIAANTTLINDLSSGSSAFSSVDIDGGTIDGTIIGQNSSADGFFQELNVTGNAEFNGITTRFRGIMSEFESDAIFMGNADFLGNTNFDGLLSIGGNASIFYSY